MIIQYEHHGALVSVQEQLKGKHKEYCLCFQNCKNFQPDSENNCPLAQELFEYDVRHDMVTPVWECPKYSRKETL